MSVEPFDVGPSASGRAEIHWDAVARSEAFRELVARRRRFVIPTTLLALGWWVAFLLLVSYAHDFMGTSIYEGLTVAYVLGLSQFVMVWLVVVAYLRKSVTDLGPLERRVVSEAGRR